MRITRTSILTGITRTAEIDVSEEQLHLWEGGALIQNVMPHLSPDEREFILSGATPDEWGEAFPEDEDCEPEWEDM